MSQRMTAAEAKLISRNVPCNYEELNEIIDEILVLVQKYAQDGERSVKFDRLGFDQSRDRHRQVHRLAIDELVSLGYVVTYNHHQSSWGSEYDDYSITISWE
jgi:hypothetical protein